MGEQVAARPKENKQGSLHDIDTGAGEGATLGRGGNRRRPRGTGANPYQLGNAVTDNWFYQ